MTTQKDPFVRVHHGTPGLLIELGKVTEDSTMLTRLALFPKRMSFSVPGIGETAADYVFITRFDLSDEGAKWLVVFNNSDGACLRYETYLPDDADIEDLIVAWVVDAPGCHEGSHGFEVTHGSRYTDRELVNEVLLIDSVRSLDYRSFYSLKINTHGGFKFRAE